MTNTILQDMQAETDDTLKWCRVTVWGSVAGMGASSVAQDGVDYIVTMIGLGYIGAVALMIGTLSLVTLNDYKRELAWQATRKEVQS